MMCEHDLAGKQARDSPGGGTAPAEGQPRRRDSPGGGTAPAEEQPVRFMWNELGMMCEHGLAGKQARDSPGGGTASSIYVERTRDDVRTRPCRKTGQGQPRLRNSQFDLDGQRTEDTTAGMCTAKDRGHRAHATNQCNSIPSLPLPTTIRTIETLSQWALSGLFDIPKQMRQTCPLAI